MVLFAQRHPPLELRAACLGAITAAARVLHGIFTPHAMHGRIQVGPASTFHMYKTYMIVEISEQEVPSPSWRWTDPVPPIVLTFS